jgi:hypothetical protein
LEQQGGFYERWPDSKIPKQNAYFSKPPEPKSA